NHLVAHTYHPLRHLLQCCSARYLDRIECSVSAQRRFLFWLSSPFLVSEREPHCVLERAVQFNDGLRAVLEPRGWIEASARLRV
ncbi:unnamed protein product, partial [Ectocarpus sp. 12 AP-2014]